MNALSIAPWRDPGWRTSPTVTLFRADLRRLWNVHALRTSVKVLVAIFAVQLAIGLIEARLFPIGSRSSWNPVYGIAGALGLTSGWTTALLSSFDQLAPGRVFRSALYPVWLAVVLGLMYVPLQMLAPAFAAQSVAPDRENGRLEELLLAGFTPRQLLLAKGLAALAPFLLLWLLLEAISLGFQLYWITHFPIRPGVPAPKPETLWLSFGLQVGLRLSMVVRFWVLVCVSALCRRYRTALVGCYSVAFLWPLLTQAATYVWTSSSLQVVSRFMYVNLGMLVLSVAVLAVILPKALAAIADPEPTQKPARQPMRIMDVGQEIPDE